MDDTLESVAWQTPALPCDFLFSNIQPNWLKWNGNEPGSGRNIIRKSDLFLDGGVWQRVLRGDRRDRAKNGKVFVLMMRRLTPGLFCRNAKIKGSLQQILQTVTQTPDVHNKTLLMEHRFPNANFTTGRNHRMYNITTITSLYNIIAILRYSK